MDPPIQRIEAYVVTLLIALKAIVCLRVGKALNPISLNVVKYSCSLQKCLKFGENSQLFVREL